MGLEKRISHDAFLKDFNSALNAAITAFDKLDSYEDIDEQIGSLDNYNVTQQEIILENYRTYFKLRLEFLESGAQLRILFGLYQTHFPERAREYFKPMRDLISFIEEERKKVLDIQEALARVNRLP